MKKYLFIIAAVMMMFSCKKETPVTPAITLTSAAEETFDTEGGIKTVTFTSNVSWTASIDNKSFSITPASGDAGTASIKVTALQNETNDPVTAKLTITAQTAKQEVNFTQLQKNALVVETLLWDTDASARSTDIKVMANVDYTVSTNDSWIKAEKKATKGLVESYITLSVTENKGEGREGSVVVSGGGINIEISVTQDAFIPEIRFEEEYFHVSTDAQEITIGFYANVDYEVTYPTEDWISITQGEDKNFTAKIKQNTTYDARRAYLKVVSKEPGHTEWIDTDWDGVPDTERQVTITATVEQAGCATFAWSRSLSSYGVESLSTVGAVHHLGCMSVMDHYVLVVTDGVQSHVLDASTGEFGASAAVPNVPNPTTFAADDAGNMIFGTYTAYGANFEVYRATEESTELLFSYPHSDIYSFGISNLRVKGDINNNAVITAVTDVYSYCVYWEIKSGVVQAPVFFALPSESAVWNADRNSCCCPLGSTADEGFIYMGYDGIYDCNIYDKAGNKTTLFTFDAGAGSNVNFQSISVKDWNGIKVAAIGISTYFSWGSCPDVILLDLTHGKQLSYLDHTTFGDIACEYVGANDGENASADVALIPEADQLGVVMIDALNNVIYRVNYPKQ